MKNSLHLCARLGILFSFLCFFSLKTHAQAVSSSEPIAFTAWNDCTGEFVDLSGNFHTVIHTHIDGSGTPHIRSTTGFQNVRGTGQDSGLKYRLVGLGAECDVPQCIGERNITILCNPVTCGEDGVVIFTGVVRQRLVSQGNADDLVISAFFHITFVDGQTVIVNQDFLSLTCH